jgi:hypothetical protein
MDRNTTACTLAGSFLALALGVVCFAFLKAHHASDELASLNQKRTVLNNGLKQAQERIAADASDRTRLEAALGKVKGAEQKTKERAAKSNPTLARVAKNPKLLELYLKSYRANLGQGFGLFYRTMGLSADQIEQFESSLSKHEESRMDLLATAASQGLGDADPAIAELRKQQDDQLQADQTALLGDAGNHQLQDFNREQAAQGIVNGAAISSLDTEPYSGAQAAQLLQILANANTSFQQGKSFDAKTVDWDSAITQAAAILSPAQLNALNAQVQRARVVTLLDNFWQQQQTK